MVENKKDRKASKFKYGDKVKVIPGTKDPDYGTDIAGWVGKIEEIEYGDDKSLLYCVLWERETIKKMGRKLIKRCERDNLDYKKIYLDEEELELVE